MSTEVQTAVRVSQETDGSYLLRAYAKLNLGLRVFPVRADGFHEIESWMVPISWHDTVRIVPGGSLRLVVTGRAEGVPTEVEKNLAGKAAVKLAKAAGIEASGTIELHKVLPPGGGIGGGSSDAANVLVGLNAAWGLHLSEERLAELAAELGSDVPFFVKGKPALCTGRGEVMTELAAEHALFAVLIIPPMGCPTKDVYQAFDAGHQHAAEVVGKKTDWERVAGATVEEMRGLLVNDLEPGAFFVAPALAKIREKAAGIAGQRVHLTGSGSTLFTLCSSGHAAGAMEQHLNAQLGEGCRCVAVRVLKSVEGS